MEPGNVVVDEFRGGGVVANDDEAGRRLDARFLPQLELRFVMAVEGFEGGLQFDGKAERVKASRLAASLPGHSPADMVPEIAEFRHVATGDVVGNRHAGQLDDAALDGVHEGEIAHRPREQGALGATGAAQEERSRREVEDAVEAELSLHRFQPGYPQPRRFAVPFGFLAVVAFQVALVVLARLLAVAVMRLVVEHQDALGAHQFRHHPLQHLALGFLGGERL